MSERTTLIRARQARGFTRVQLAKALNASRHYIYHVELGQRDPSFALMRRWVELLGYGASMELFWNTPIRPDPAGRRARVKPATSAAE